jgi:hypothetical protein
MYETSLILFYSFHPCLEHMDYSISYTSTSEYVDTMSNVDARRLLNTSINPRDELGNDRLQDTVF